MNRPRFLIPLGIRGVAAALVPLVAWAVGFGANGQHDRHRLGHRDGRHRGGRVLRPSTSTPVDVWTGFRRMHQAAVADGALPAKVKELMALAIAVVNQCDGCIADRAEAAAIRGASADEVADALGVALLVDGGPASVCTPRAWAAFHDFADTDAVGAPR